MQDTSEESPRWGIEEVLARGRSLILKEVDPHAYWWRPEGISAEKDTWL